LHSEATKEKIRQRALVSQKKRFENPEERKKISLALMGNTPWNIGISCPSDVRAKISASKRGCAAWNKGLKTGPLSEEHKRKCSESHKKLGAPTWDTKSRSSSLTWKLAEILTVSGFEVVVPEQRFGKYVVDVLLAEDWVAFEADGVFWHDKNRLKHAGMKVNELSDDERDSRLFEEYDLPVVRLTEDEVNVLYENLVMKGN